MGKEGFNNDPIAPEDVYIGKEEVRGGRGTDFSADTFEDMCSILGETKYKSEGGNVYTPEDIRSRINQVLNADDIFHARQNIALVPRIGNLRQAVMKLKEKMDIERGAK
jgi:hypothetical protein